MSIEQKAAEAWPIAFILVTTPCGPMLINRFDLQSVDGDRGYGVAWELLNHGSYSSEHGDLLRNILLSRREHFGDGVVAIDCGAHVGMYSVDWARMMQGWGNVISIEAQERMYYALAGNLTLNNCFNAKAIWGVVGGYRGAVRVQVPNYFVETSFASLEVHAIDEFQSIGQSNFPAHRDTQSVSQFPIDALGLERIDLLKLDIEGMEIHALRGAAETISRCRPVIYLDKSKVASGVLKEVLLSHPYEIHELGSRLLAVHFEDPIRRSLAADSQP